MLALNSPSFENLITDFVIEIAVICFHYYICIYIDLSMIGQKHYYEHPEEYYPVFHETIAPYASVIGKYNIHYTHAHTRAYIYKCVCVCVCVSLYICMHVCMCICICTHNIYLDR